MMSKGQMSMGDLSAFMLYAGYVGMSVGGKLDADFVSEFYVILRKCPLLNLLL